MKEIRYAALLHDFGKVGVREEVLIKAKKLYPLQFVRVLDRFDYIRRDIEARVSQQKAERCSRFHAKRPKSACACSTRKRGVRWGNWIVTPEFIARANEPTLLPTSDFDLLNEIAHKTYRDPRGTERPYLSSEEVRFLSIRAAAWTR